MNVDNIVKNLDKLLMWITKLTLLNMLWFLYSVLGLVVGGVFPATVSALGVAKKWLAGEREIKTHLMFKEIFKREFKSANKLGWTLTIIGILLYINYRLIDNDQGQLSILVPAAFYIIVFLYLLITLWSFPMLTYYQTTTFKYIKNSLVIGLTKLHISLAIGVLLFAVTYHSLNIPVLFLFFYISSCAIGWMWLAIRVFTAIPAEKT
ncbi:YesL family protein [Halobacillus massiliensis]|uniref:YesL family protein n=1 Tax=Halobacillus massiliensis TaxID=1926286 RepID=UPI0009E250D6|nr:DUF624 domain-containing protein [Halobacillus massiliensis]